MSNNLRCISHRSYDGKTSPNLLCRACCKIYIEHIRLINEDFEPILPEESNTGKEESQKPLPSKRRWFGKDRQSGVMKPSSDGK